MATIVSGPITVGGIRQRLFATAAGALLAALAITGSTLSAQATGGDRKVILTVTGNIDKKQDGKTVDFTVEELEALGAVQTTTITPFTKGEVHFTGVLLQQVLDSVGAHCTTLKTTALNDYSVDIPCADTKAYDVMLATRIDGKLLPVREKGPIWVIYPWSQHPELNTPTYGARSIWQVRSIEAR